MPIGQEDTYPVNTLTFEPNTRQYIAEDAWSIVDNMNFLPVRNIQIIIAIFIFSTISSSATADIFSCTKDGKKIYTDDKSQCGQTVSKIHLDIQQSHRVNYRYPARTYENKSSSYLIFVETPETEKDKVNMDKAVKRLNETLDLVYNAIPQKNHSYLKNITFYIMIGPNSKLGGERSGLRYHPKSGDMRLLLGDTRWSRSVVIYSVRNFIGLSDIWTKKVIMHELSHAWHYKDWNKNYPILRKAWLSSRRKSLYLSQKNVQGKILKPTYASTNEKEYFAELSAIYFVGGNYYPFNKNDLKSYDPEGYSLIEQLWGL